VKTETLALGGVQNAVHHDLGKIVTLADDGATDTSGSGSNFSFHDNSSFPDRKNSGRKQFNLTSIVIPQIAVFFNIFFAHPGKIVKSTNLPGKKGGIFVRHRRSPANKALFVAKMNAFFAIFSFWLHLFPSYDRIFQWSSADFYPSVSKQHMR
jgi:hypothetical protein